MLQVLKSYERENRDKEDKENRENNLSKELNILDLLFVEKLG
jgi:hypothetical protein